jgi:hypothetical protein
MNLELLGYIGALLTTASFIPQAIMTIRSRDTRGISRGMYVIFTTGVRSGLRMNRDRFPADDSREHGDTGTRRHRGIPLKLRYGLREVLSTVAETWRPQAYP